MENVKCLIFINPMQNNGKAYYIKLRLQEVL